MKRHWLALSIFVLGCMVSAQAEDGDFFPLEVGNRWVFQIYDKQYDDVFPLDLTLSIEVTGQVQLQGRAYFVVQQEHSWALSDTLYLRKEGTQVFRYIEQPDTVALGSLSQERGRPDPHPLDPTQTD